MQGQPDLRNCQSQARICYSLVGLHHAMRATLSMELDSSGKMQVEKGLIHVFL